MENNTNHNTNSRVIGKCPHCGGKVIYGKYGAYCRKKCGMHMGRFMGVMLTKEQAKAVLNGEKILMQGLTSKSGTTYDAYLTPQGVAPFSYTNKDGEEVSGWQYQYLMEFPDDEEDGEEGGSIG